MPVDPRFFEPLATPTLGEIADLTGAVLIGVKDQTVSDLSASESAGGGDLAFFEGTPKQAASVSPQSGACFVKENAVEGLPDGVPALVTAAPRWAHIQAAKSMFRLRNWNDGGAEPRIHPSANIAPGAFIGAGAAIGADASLGPNCVIGPGVQIGARTQIGAGATLQCALVGDDVKILSGARIGEAGFGVTASPDGAADVPQWGRVIIQDSVMIGANTCVDRGAFDDTIIGERSKIDNLCQIGHNVIIGRDVMMASFGGISGSVKIDDGVTMGGRVGIADHVHIGAGARLAASAGIFRDIPAGETWGGVPGRPLKQYLREVAWLQKQIAPKTPNK